jgi:hypothetical protein
MPRKSPEATSAAWFRAHQSYGNGGRPRPPAWLNAEAKRTFAQIVNSRAPDLFMPGSLELLAQFCFIDTIARRLWAEHAKLPVGDRQAMRLARQALSMVSLMCTLGNNLALMPRHTHGNRSGVLSERYSAEKDGDVGDAPLLGSNVVRF